MKWLNHMRNSFKKLTEEILKELVEVGGKGQFILMYKGHLWFFNGEKKPTIKEKKLLKHFLKTAKFDLDEVRIPDEENWRWDFVQEVLQEKNRHDIIAADFDGEVLNIYQTGTFVHEPRSSISIKKLVKHLNPNEVTYQEVDDMTTLYKHDILGEIPDKAYHGTSSRYLEKIIRIGLRPRKETGEKGNYDTQGIEHFEHIFFATRIGEAHHHAVTTAMQTSSLPIVLEFTIPDKTRILPDYDVETMAGDEMKTFAHIAASPRVEKIDIKPERLSQEVGVYGYGGAIPPKYFTKIYVGKDQEIYEINDYEEFDVESEGKMAVAQAFQLISMLVGDENPYEELLYDSDDVHSAATEIDDRLDNEGVEGDERDEKAEEISYEVEDNYGIPAYIILNKWREEYGQEA